MTRTASIGLLWVFAFPLGVNLDAQANLLGTLRPGTVTSSEIGNLLPIQKGEGSPMERMELVCRL
jgi:hypothetical protein